VLIDAAVKVASVFRTGSTSRNAELTGDLGHLKLCLNLVQELDSNTSENQELAGISVAVTEIADQLLAELWKASADTNSKLLTKASVSLNAI
jgi:hypothetical protein